MICVKIVSVSGGDKMLRSCDTEHTNMIMIYNRQKNAAVVINRKISWCGISFPGGHLEPGESAYESASRG